MKTQARAIKSDPMAPLTDGILQFSESSRQLLIPLWPGRTFVGYLVPSAFASKRFTRCPHQPRYYYPAACSLPDPPHPTHTHRAQCFLTAGCSFTFAGSGSPVVNPFLKIQTLSSSVEPSAPFCYLLRFSSLCPPALPSSHFEGEPYPLKNSQCLSP